VAVTLESIRACLEGVIPSGICSCSADGVPNVTYLSHVHYVDAEHVALSFQFFNKTRRNVLSNPRVAVLVVDPHTARQYHLDLEYVRTETTGTLFESMKLRLDATASLTGMTGVFRLLGADVYRVLECHVAPGRASTLSADRAPLLENLSRLSAEMAACDELSRLLDVVLAGLAKHLGYTHAMVLLRDESAPRLYTVASHGYPQSGAGSELALGQGAIGVAAERGTPVRITQMTRDLLFGRAVRRRLMEEGDATAVEREITLPGLPDARSQLAMPMRTHDRTLGVLCVESTQALAFTAQDEVFLRVVASHLATAIRLSSQSADGTVRGMERTAGTSAAAGSRGEIAALSTGPPVLIRHYAYDHSIFIGNDYLIKGVAGAILWRLTRDHVREGRSEFTNRELRVDPTIGLPDLSDNLEARLVLLKRRLEDRCDVLRIDKVGRGRFRLVVSRRLELQEMGHETQRRS
jgi:GAF domain/Pyridoxamine 5'-phosphate oxidase